MPPKTKDHRPHDETTQKATFVWPNYADSVFAQRVLDVITTLNDLEKKYPAHKKDPIEKLHGHQTIASLKKIILKLEHILKHFDHGTRPNLLQLVAAALDLNAIRKSIDKTFMTRKGAMFFALKDDLPKHILNALKKTAKLPVDQQESHFGDLIAAHLKQRKEASIKEALLIPGEEINQLYAAMSDKILEILTYNYAALPRIKMPKIISFLEESILDNKAFALIIGHPMIYELATSLLDYNFKLPPNLSTLIPFFNPEALRIDAHTGITASLIKLLENGESFKLAPTQQTAPGTAPDPDYEIRFERFLKNDPEPDVTITFAPNTIYLEQLDFSKVFIINGVLNYFVQNPESAHVKSEQARIQLLRQLVENESEALQQITSTMTPINIINRSSLALPSSQLLEKHQEDLLILKQQQAHNTSQLQHTYQLEADLATKPVKQFLNKYPDLVLQIEQNKMAGLDISYIEHPFPSFVFHTDFKDLITIIQINENFSRTLQDKREVLLEQGRLLSQQEQKVSTAILEIHRGFRQSACERVEGVDMEDMTNDEQACNAAENSTAQSINHHIISAKSIEQDDNASTPMPEAHPVRSTKIPITIAEQRDRFFNPRPVATPPATTKASEEPIALLEHPLQNSTC